jgi:tryptophan synthase alpha chain
MTTNSMTTNPAERKIMLYRDAVFLFEKQMSHPQVVEVLLTVEDDHALAVDIADRAMYEAWYKMHLDILRLYVLNWNRSEVVDLLKHQEKHFDVIELLCDDIYNRQVDLMNAEDEHEYRARWWPYLLSFGAFNIWYSLKKGWGIYITVAAIIVTVIGFIGALKSIFMVKKYVKTVDRFIMLDIFKEKREKSRLDLLFKKKKDHLLNIYCTAGYPKLDSTLTVLKSLQQSGVDIIELGMPYSDPLADGPVIQASSVTALNNGMTIPFLFEQLKNFRSEIHIPVVLMGYLNPILQYGFEKFCAKAFETGIDGLIIPDIPVHEYEREYKNIVTKYGLDFIFLITPETSEERIRKLDDLGSGFLYAVSSSSITGSDKNFSEVAAYLKRLRQMNLKNPLQVGFGIRDRETFEQACAEANGAIIGTAYVKAIENGSDIDVITKDFVEGILGR